jgi:hypothetical protein
VEALATGRKFIGCDLNPLSHFIAKIKTSPLSDRGLREVVAWANLLADEPDLRTRSMPDRAWESYQLNLPWWLRNVIEVALARTAALSSEKVRQFARGALLRTGQWALDCRKTLPTAREFVSRLQENTVHMAEGMNEYRKRIEVSSLTPRQTESNRRLMLGNTAEALGNKRLPKNWRSPRLILTSPPYLGVHILYHRWQVRGRRESPAPFWIAGSLDGFGASYYTFGDRQRKDPGTYMNRLKACMAPVVNLMDSNSLLVQLVAFAEPESQLTPYLETLQSCGLRECGTPRMWRCVPNRKWYAQLQGSTSSSREVLLVHQKP